ncbi:hypothetical protein BDQ17DRAFT_1257955, partial [Cyathus striatus]
VSDDFPCGFCGQPMSKGKCQIHSISHNRVDSLCKYAYPLLLSTALHVSKSKPCTNIPIACKIAGCGEIHWKYNML